MNRRDRKIVDRIDGVLRVVGTLTPTNPTDVKAICANLPIATTAARALSRAITAVREQDWTAADEHLAAAEQIVAQPAERAR